MKNCDSVPQLQHFSYVGLHHCAARSRHGSYLRRCSHSLLQRQLAALLQCGLAGHGFGGLVQHLQDQSLEPLVWTIWSMEWGSDRAMNRIELNRIDSFVTLNRIESNRFLFLPNRPSLAASPRSRRHQPPPPPLSLYKSKSVAKLLTRVVNNTITPPPIVYYRIRKRVPKRY